MAEVLLGLGGNVGDPIATISKALAALERAGVRISARSSFYRTPPWGVTDQPPFVNCCVAGETELPPRGVLAASAAVEAELGRERVVRWGPRTVDIDILAYDDLVIDEPGLTIPHPRATERAFVLVPLAEISPDRIIHGRTVGAWAAKVDSAGIDRLAL